MYMKSWLHSLVRSTPWQRSRKSPVRRPSMQQVASYIENLEDRTLLSISATFDTTTMQLKVTSDASDPIIVTTSGPFVKVNGVDPLRGPTLGTTTLAADVQSILIEGGPGANNIDLSAVTTLRFSGLNNQITIMGGDGADTIVGTGFRDSIEGNEASDLITGGSGGPDTISGGDGADTITGTNGGDSLTGDGAETSSTVSAATTLSLPGVEPTRSTAALERTSSPAAAATTRSLAV